MKQSRQVTFIVLSIVLIIAAFAAGFAFGRQTKNTSAGQSELPSDVVCTLEARVCPDGTAVGRQGKDCSFAACPGDTPDQKL